MLSRRGIGALLLFMLLSLAVPALASAQATRTWVSGVGDDANPCSRTAPCKTFAGAISKTAVGGEIDALDPGGFGALTITKAITIDGGGGQVASTLVSGTNGIVVAAGPSDHVILRNLRFDGLLGGPTTPGINGIRFISGAGLRLQNDYIFGFSNNGVDVELNQSTPATVAIDATTIENNGGAGVAIDNAQAPAPNALLDGDTIENNACGVVAGSIGCAAGGTEFSRLTVASSSISGNSGDGILSTGPNANVFAAGDLVSGNALGLDARSGGKIVSVCGNTLAGNNVDGSPTSTDTTGCPGAVVGPTGPRGATGPRGPAGDIELVTCRKVKVHKHRKTKCTGRLVSGPVSFTVAGRAVRASLARAGATVAKGTVLVGHAGDVGLMSVTRKLRPGRYVLTLWSAGRVVARQDVLVR